MKKLILLFCVIGLFINSLVYATGLSGIIIAGGGGSIATIPAAPTGVSATAGNLQNTVGWTPSSGSTSCNLYWKSGSSMSGNCIANGTKVSSVRSPDVIGSLTGGTTYYYMLTCQNSAGESSCSSEVSGTPTSCTAQSITWGTQPTDSLTVGGSNGSVGSATSTSGLTVSYVSSNTGVFTISGSSTVPVAAGTADIVASQAGNATYCAANSVASNNVVVSASTNVCNSTTYTNNETCTYYNHVIAAGGTIANLAMYDAYVTAVKTLTTTGCNGTFPGCAGMAYDPNFGYHTISSVVDTAYDGTDITGARTAIQTVAGAMPSIVTNAVNASCTGSGTPYPSCTGSGTGTLPNMQAFVYNGSTTYLGLNTLPTFLQGASSFFGVVGGSTTIAANGQVFAYGLNSASLGQPYFELETSSNIYAFDNYNGASNYSYSAYSTASNTTKVYILETNVSSSWAESNAKVNGGTSISPTSLSPSAGTTQNYANIGRFWYSNTNYFYWKGNIFSLLGFKVSLSSSDMTIIRNFLKTYYPVY